MLTGDSKYLNYYERALYNHILASQDPDLNGCVTYYTTLMPGLFKQYSTPYESFWCCVGTGLENHAKYAESVYFMNDKNLLVNLFIPSELKSKETGLNIILNTKYPASDTITLTINDLGKFNGKFKFRIPDWLKSKPELFVNGHSINSSSDSNEFVEINSENIKKNDKITLVLHRTLYLYSVKDEPHFGSLMYGPLVLAGELGKENMPGDRVSDNRGLRAETPLKNIPMIVGDLANLDKWILQDKVNPLKFNVKNNGKQEDISLVPFFQLHHQRTTVYWKIYSTTDLLLRSKALTDEIVIADAQNENKHNLKGENHRTEWHDFFWAKNLQYRIAENGGWFAYDLKINPKETKPYSLICRFWGDENNEHEFDIYIDNQKLTDVNLSRRLYLTYVDDVFAIPQELTKK